MNVSSPDVGAADVGAAETLGRLLISLVQGLRRAQPAKISSPGG